MDAYEFVFAYLFCSPFEAMVIGQRSVEGRTRGLSGQEGRHFQKY